MGFDAGIHHRKSLRLQDYDYSQAGAYFITICTHHRECLFGHITDGQMHLNLMGEIAQNEWLKTETMRPAIRLHEYVIMPNHTHCIIEFVGAHCMRPGDASTLTDNNLQYEPGQVQAEQGLVQRSPTVGDVVRGYKSAVTKRINELRDVCGTPIWQRNYHEHVIRNETAYLKISEYVQTNPQRWQEDTYHI